MLINVLTFHIFNATFIDSDIGLDAPLHSLMEFQCTSTDVLRASRLCSLVGQALTLACYLKEKSRGLESGDVVSHIVFGHI
uniref:Uncharacterized protein n=1 Tax=Lepeophtheirus salmonis TaxID=72036 RepID=A0A0K2SYN9_LEPSM